MGQRPTLQDVLTSELPQAIGHCAADVFNVSAAVNAATQRLLYAREGGDAGWAGAWAEIAFDLTQSEPVFTAPYDVARIESLDVCTFPVPIQNQFYEYLRYGFGRWPKSVCATDRCAPLIAYDRGTVPTFADLQPPNTKLWVYLTDTGDAGKRVLIQGKDNNGVIVRTLDGLVQVSGQFLTLSAPFVATPQEWRAITGIQKDTTLGRVSFYEFNTVTSAQRLLLTMEPGETVASYRRYYVGGLPSSCCNPPTVGNTVQVTALVKLEFVPVRVPTDYLLIGNVEALTHEAQAGRYMKMDTDNAKQQAEYHHRAAIRLLQGQLVHQTGKLLPAINFAPFGTARLKHQKIGTLT